MRTGAPLLQVEDLAVEFGSGGRVVKAVDGVSLTLHAGETLGILGESGSGKSVTSLAIMRLLRGSRVRVPRGRVLFEGEDLFALSRGAMRRVRGGGIGMIFQDPMTSLNPVLTIGRQLVEPMQIHLRLSRRDALARAAALLSTVGIADAASRLSDYPHQLSGGMRQRVMIAIAVSCRPKLLIADEPTTGLDVTIQAQILQILKSLQEELGMAMIFITHDLGVVAGMADRLAVMYAGRIVEEGPTDAVFADPRMPYTIGLMRSIPGMEDEDEGPLHPIGGQPPDLSALPPGCAFAPRCSHAAAVCREAAPPARAAGPGHTAVCHFEITKAAGPERARARA